MLRGNLPRSPVWLRKIPSTVSGSQGSRRGLRPAVRFAFPLGAKMYITDFPAPGQGKVRIRAELFRRAGGFRRIVGVSPGRAIVTDGPLPPILVEESPQPGRSGAMRESSERSSPRAMSATRPRAIRAPLLAPLQKQPFPPTRIGHSRHHMPANRAIAFSPIRPPPADLRSIRADRGLSEGAGRGRQHDRGAEHVQGIGHKAQLQCVLSSSRRQNRRYDFDTFGVSRADLFFYSRDLPSISAFSILLLAPPNSTSLPWCMMRSMMAEASLSSPNTTPHLLNSIFVVITRLRFS